MKKKRIVVAITGASGAIYAQLLLGALRQKADQLEEVSVVFSDNALDIWEYELDEEWVPVFPFRRYENNDFYAPFASGSVQYDAMIICPCSMGMLGRIASGVSDDLITRTADVMLKERRKLIVVPRETPYSLIHLKNMKTVTEAGAVICPATPSFYSKPETIEQLAMTVVERILDQAGIKQDAFRWGDTPKQ